MPALIELLRPALADVEDTQLECIANDIEFDVFRDGNQSNRGWVAMGARARLFDAVGHPLQVLGEFLFDDIGLGDHGARPFVRGSAAIVTRPRR
ncbi:MAG: hypothetical protein IPK83_23230 [Planctomycetes bacterium]|nr:hypothetical protein [Planctomycetota bacterium]